MGNIIERRFQVLGWPRKERAISKKATARRTSTTFSTRRRVIRLLSGGQATQAAAQSVRRPGEWDPKVMLFDEGARPRPSTRGMTGRGVKVIAEPRSGAGAPSNHRDPVSLVFAARGGRRTTKIVFMIAGKVSRKDRRPMSSGQPRMTEPEPSSQKSNDGASLGHLQRLSAAGEPRGHRRPAAGPAWGAPDGAGRVSMRCAKGGAHVDMAELQGRGQRCLARHTGGRGKPGQSSPSGAAAADHGLANAACPGPAGPGPGEERLPEHRGSCPMK